MTDGWHIRVVLTRTPLGLLLLVSLTSWGCERATERTLRDSEGRQIRASCSRDGKCALELTSGSPASPAENKLALYSPGNLVGICDTKDGKPAAAKQCRPLVCSGDGDCPPNHGLKNGTCINGLCREPSRTITVEDSVMLCLAGTGVGDTRPDLVALALNCGTPCRIPAVCRQP